MKKGGNFRRVLIHSILFVPEESQSNFFCFVSLLHLLFFFLKRKTCTFFRKEKKVWICRVVLVTNWRSRDICFFFLVRLLLAPEVISISKADMARRANLWKDAYVSPFDALRATVEVCLGVKHSYFRVIFHQRRNERKIFY